MASIRDTLVGLLRDNFRVPEEKIVPEASFNADLGLDSIDLVDLLSLLNQKFDVYYSPFDFESCRTLGEFESRLTALLEKKK